ncbi:Magnesium transporter NIPA4 [Hondaea fermentalgiana]|uniref:Magnesium transporter NIPA4 n=1 Tax=Hondaea fermentalgiana TaxID=2315210 RepID=A0A2R5GTR6_9STRA|nr:Magnesium transporter NIPA4 [Hondaea fermentalgiana]|eukprot:GBG34240.1 Magnesium transporter NIPA4 [Hondaea fermentalgiana]
MRCDAVRCGAMRWDAMGCGAMRWDAVAVRCDTKCGDGRGEGKKMSDFFSLSCNSTETTDDGDETTVFGDLPWLWLLGMACSVVSSFATALGTILQKKAHMEQEALPDEEKSYEFIGIIFNKHWLFALCVMGLIPLPFDFTAFALAPQSLVVTMTGLTIVLNQLFAPYLLQEKLTRVEIIGTIIIVTGVIITSVTAGGNPSDFDVCELVSRYSDTDVLAMAFSIISLMCLCLFLIHSNKHPDSIEPLRPEFYAFVAGGFAGLMQIAFKATGELVKGIFGTADSDVNPWKTIWPYVHIIAVFFLAVGMISYINRGLQAYDAVLFTPLYFTNLIVLSSSLGLVYYKEYENFEVWQMIVYPFGVAIVCGGILFMTIKGVDIPTVRARIARLNKSRENMKSMRFERQQLDAARSSRSLAALTHSVRLNRPLSAQVPGRSTLMKFPSVPAGLTSWRGATTAGPSHLDEQSVEVSPADPSPSEDSDPESADEGRR